jgi:hypothetical protein
MANSNRTFDGKERIPIYIKKDEQGKDYFCWNQEDEGGYYNLIAMIRLKGLNVKDIYTI